ncbi:MAG: hypothetical protein MJ211_12570 [Bacteroidales bacterium]|nr:hypothetical protein [Bacteroidales bacterium]
MKKIYLAIVALSLVSMISACGGSTTNNQNNENKEATENKTTEVAPTNTCDDIPFDEFKLENAQAGLNPKIVKEGNTYFLTFEDSDLYLYEAAIEQMAGDDVETFELDASDAIYVKPNGNGQKKIEIWGNASFCTQTTAEDYTEYKVEDFINVENPDINNCVYYWMHNDKIGCIKYGYWVF